MRNTVLRKVSLNTDGSLLQLDFASEILGCMVLISTIEEFLDFSETFLECSGILGAMVSAFTGNEISCNTAKCVLLF